MLHKAWCQCNSRRKINRLSCIRLCPWLHTVLSHWTPSWVSERSLSVYGCRMVRCIQVESCFHTALCWHRTLLRIGYSPYPVPKQSLDSFPCLPPPLPQMFPPWFLLAPPLKNMESKLLLPQTSSSLSCIIFICPSIILFFFFCDSFYREMAQRGGEVSLKTDHRTLQFTPSSSFIKYFFMQFIENDCVCFTGQT